MWIINCTKVIKVKKVYHRKQRVCPYFLAYLIFVLLFKNPYLLDHIEFCLTNIFCDLLWLPMNGQGNSIEHSSQSQPSELKFDYTELIKVKAIFFLGHMILFRLSLLLFLSLLKQLSFVLLPIKGLFFRPKHVWNKSIANFFRIDATFFHLLFIQLFHLFIKNFLHLPFFLISTLLFQSDPLVLCSDAAFSCIID